MNDGVMYQSTRDWSPFGGVHVVFGLQWGQLCVLEVDRRTPTHTHDNSSTN